MYFVIMRRFPRLHATANLWGLSAINRGEKKNAPCHHEEITETVCHGKFVGFEHY